MKNKKIQTVLEKVYADNVPEQSDVEFLLGVESDTGMQILFDFADNVRRKFCGDGILLRGIVEFGSFCRNTCLYCGLNKNNKKLQRYRLTKEELIGAAKQIVSAGIKTVVLQSGEDDGLDVVWFGEIIKKIKQDFGMSVTLSVGERSFEDYKIWKEAGADRYLLKIETANKVLYQSLHPEMSFENRIECSGNLKSLGYQNGSGCLVGIKGQTIQTLAEDILFFKKEDFDMIGIGVFIPHEHTVLGKEPLGNIKLALKVLAITRIVTKDTHLPATTAIGSIGGNDERVKALKAGANVIMPNFTPEKYRKLYDIYPDKRCVRELSCGYLKTLEMMATETNRWIDFSRGDSLKLKTEIVDF
jgi:biotin synthase